MSALIVGEHHVAYLVEAAIRLYPRHRATYWGAAHERVDYLTADAVGAALLAENVASIAHRYEHRPDCAELAAAPYVHREPRRPLDPVIVLKAIDYYEYQSCEHPGWEASDAARFCRELRSAYTGQLPGYAAAPWGLD